MLLMNTSKSTNPQKNPYKFFSPPTKKSVFLYISVIIGRFIRWHQIITLPQTAIYKINVVDPNPRKITEGEFQSYFNNVCNSFRVSKVLFFLLTCKVSLNNWVLMHLLRCGTRIMYICFARMYKRGPLY